MVFKFLRICFWKARLCRSVRTGNLRSVEHLLKAQHAKTSLNESFLGRYPVHDAVYNDRPEVLKALLEAGALTTVRTKSGYTPLGAAAYVDRLQCAAILLEHGAEVNSAESTIQCTPLYVAIFDSSLELLKLLLDNGADPNMCTGNGTMPLKIACAWRDKECVQFLKVLPRLCTRPPRRILSSNGPLCTRPLGGALWT